TARRPPDPPSNLHHLRSGRPWQSCPLLATSPRAPAAIRGASATGVEPRPPPATNPRAVPHRCARGMAVAQRPRVLRPSFHHRPFLAARQASLLAALSLAGCLPQTSGPVEVPIEPA